MRKKIILLVMSFLLVLGSGVSAYASNLYVYSVQGSSYDEDMLNCYTSGAVVSGTYVSLWATTGNPSQLWIFRRESNGRYSMRPLANTSVALNANRSYVGINVNVITASTNILSDYTLVPSAPVAAGQRGYLAMEPRGGHTGIVAVTSHGNRALCTWEYLSDSLYNHQYFGVGIYG